MKSLASFPRFLVLSQGRTGSNLLCVNLGYALDIEPRTQHIIDLAELNPNSRIPIHCHELIPHQVLRDYTVVFSVRKNIIDTVISRFASNRYRVFANWYTRPIDKFEPFEASSHVIDQTCQGYLDFYEFYRPWLKEPTTLCVTFEDLVKVLPDTKTFVPLFPDKKSILSNYDQVVDRIKTRWLAQLEQVLEPYFDHCNNFDLLGQLHHELSTNTIKNFPAQR